MSSAFLWLLLFLFLLPLGRAVVRYLESSAERKALPPAPCTPEEYRELREQVQILAGRVDKLREDNEFLTRLLEERPASRAIANTEETDR
ncbi:MAG: hypothetical protein ACE5JR_04865 [Gemmatimonadota bacterium]